MEFLAPVLTAIKDAGPRIYATVFVVSLCLVALPVNWIEAIGLTEFRASYRAFLALALITSFALLVVHFLFSLSKPIRKVYRNWRLDRNTKLVLSDLTKDEKILLRRYINDGENSCYQSIYDGVANGLEAKNIVYRASQLSVPGTPGQKFPYNLQPYARKILNKSPSLLD
ncbi:super-infection exclusion protein B [Leptospira interrogans]